MAALRAARAAEPHAPKGRCGEKNKDSASSARRRDPGRTSHSYRRPV